MNVDKFQVGHEYPLKNGVMVKVVEDIIHYKPLSPCIQCHFKNKDCDEISKYCTSQNRIDGLSVHFIKVKKRGNL